MPALLRVHGSQSFVKTPPSERMLGMARYPNFKSERPFAMPAKVERTIRKMDAQQLQDAMLREMELRGRYEWMAAQALKADPALVNPRSLTSGQ